MVGFLKLTLTGKAEIKDVVQGDASLKDEIDPASLVGVSIDPIKLMTGSLASAQDFSFRKLIQEKKVEDGKEWVENTDKKWYKPWTWFQEKGYYRQKYKTVKYIPAGDLAQEFFTPVEDGLYGNGESARKYALKQANRIAAAFNEEFSRLDNVLRAKLAELETIAADGKQAEERIAETERRLAWLETIKSKVASILEI